MVNIVKKAADLNFSFSDGILEDNNKERFTIQCQEPEASCSRTRCRQMYRKLISKIHMKEKNRKPNVLMTRESRTVKRDLYVTENLSFKKTPAGHSIISAFRLLPSIIEAYLNHLQRTINHSTSLHRL